MIFIGHFAHRTIGPHASHGYFTMLIDAIDIVEAIDDLLDQLRQLQVKRSLFPPSTEITLVNCVEVRRPSRDGLLMQFWSLSGSDFVEVSTALPDVDQLDAVGVMVTAGDRAQHDGVPEVVMSVSSSGEATIIGKSLIHPRDGPSPG